MIFEQVTAGGRRSYHIGCEASCAAAIMDPEPSQIDRYLALANQPGLQARYLLDTHTHADHYSASRQLARRFDVPMLMHQASPALLIGTTGRTDLPTGDPEALHDRMSRRPLSRCDVGTSVPAILRLSQGCLPSARKTIDVGGRSTQPVGEPQLDQRLPCHAKA